MDSNPIEEGVSSGRIEATDDVEGHMPFKRIDDETVEGHGFSGHVDGPDTDDVEGHMPRIKILDAEEPSDETVEGHGFRGNVEVDEDDDTEGHAARVKI